MPLAGTWLLAVFAAVVLVLAWLVRRWHARDEARFQWELDHPRELSGRRRALPPPATPASSPEADRRRSRRLRGDD
jgi:hypothetical protein